MSFTPLQNGSGHGANGVFIDETTKTIYVAEVKSTQAAVDAAKNAQGSPLAKISNWANKAANNTSGWETLSEESVEFGDKILSKLNSGVYNVQGVEIKISVPKPGTEGVTQLTINDWK